MRFIDPRTDFAFKKIFGSVGHEGVLRSFLNALLYGGRDEITQLKLQDPYNIPRLKGMKDSYLDVRVRQSDGKWILVEMQVVNVPGFEKRVLYNAAKQYSNQAIKGQDYDTLDPVVILAITDFILFKDWPDVTSRYHLREKEKLVTYPDEDIELVFVELPKFHTTHDKAEKLWEKWLCFLKESPNLKAVPASLAQVPEIKEAFDIANYSNLSEEEEWALMQKLQWLSAQKKLRKMQEDAVKELEKSRGELKKSETRRKQAEAKQKQAEAKQKQAETKQKQTQMKLRNAALALRQSGMNNMDICKIMDISSQQLQRVLTKTSES
ncbi:MAG: Rpn family recombination-promoting nuclease/putative transposase [Myxococcota bacterium]